MGCKNKKAPDVETFILQICFLMKLNVAKGLITFVFPRKTVWFNVVLLQEINDIFCQQIILEIVYLRGKNKR